MSEFAPQRNKAFVLEAFDTLFNKHDYAAAERFWSYHYIQHSAHIAPGRAGLFDLIRTQPETLRYENHLIMAEGDYVIAHGRFSGNGRPAAWIAVQCVVSNLSGMDVGCSSGSRLDGVIMLQMVLKRWPSLRQAGWPCQYTTRSTSSRAMVSLRRS